MPNADPINTICHDDMLSESKRTDGGTTLNSAAATVAIIADWTTSDCTPNRAVTRARADCRGVSNGYFSAMRISENQAGWSADSRDFCISIA